MAQARAAFRINRETSAARGSPRVLRSCQSSCLRRCHCLKPSTEIALDLLLHSRGDRSLKLSGKYVGTALRERTGAVKSPNSPYAIIFHMLTLLRLALGLYFLGLTHSVLTILRKKETFFWPAVVAMIAGFLCHTAAIIYRAYELQA